MSEALAEANVAADEVSLVVASAGDDADERGECAALHGVLGERATSVAVLRPKRLFGDTLGASEGLGLLAALAAGTGGIALVNAFQMGGSVASFVVRVGEHS